MWGGGAEGGKVDFQILHFYALNFEEVDGAYCFRVLRLSRTVHARILKFHILWIPPGKIVDPYFFFLSELSPFLELCPFEKIRMISRKVFEPGQLIGDEE